MPAIYQGDKKIVDRYIGETLVTRTYQGDKLIFDAYSELSDTLPLAIRSRASQVLKNYRIYGASGSTNILPPQTDTSVWDTVGYIKDNGGLREDQNYMTTTFLDAAEGTLSFTNTSPDSSWHRFGWYDENQAWLSETSGYSDTATVTPPASAVYMRISINTASDVSFVIAGSAGVGDKTVNLYNYANDEVNKYINGYGQISTWNSGINYVSDKIPVVPGKTYTLIAPLTVYGTVTYAAFYKSDDTPITSIDVGAYTLPYEKTYTITAPSGASYFRTSIKRAVGAQSVTMLVEGPTAPETYIPHGYQLQIKVTAGGTTTDYPVYIGDSQLMAEEYVDYSEQKVYKRTANLFSENMIDPESNKYIDDHGQKASWEGWKCSVFVPVVQNLMYTFNPNSTEGLYGRHCFYDENQEFISAINSGKQTFTTPSGCEFMRFSFRTVSQNITLVEGPTAPESYIPYLQPTDPPVPFPDITTPQGEVTIDIDGSLKPQAAVKGRINPTA